MSTRVKLVLLVITALFITALVMVPRIIEAKRSGAEVVENNATPAANPVQGRRQEVASGRIANAAKAIAATTVRNTFITSAP